MKQQEITEQQKSVTKLFKKYIVKRPNGNCQVLFALTELDDLVDEIIASLTSEAVKKERERVRERIEQVFDPFRSSNQKIKGKRRFGIANFKVGARDLHDKVLSALSKERTDEEKV